MSRRGISQNKQVQRIDRMDPFSGMNQMMRGFGGFANDPFFGAMMGFGGDPFEDMFKFSDAHKNIHQRGVEGSYVCQSFVSSSKMGPDGKIIREDYFQNSMGQHSKGNTISQKQQAYKNSSGVNRIAEERMLNDKGRKIIKQRNGRDIQQTNHYYNLDQEQSSKFDSDWRQANSNMKFLQNHQRHLQQIGNERPRHMELGYEPSYQRQNKDHKNSQIKSKKGSEKHSRPSQSNYSESRGSRRNQLPSHANSRKY